MSHITCPCHHMHRLYDMPCHIIYAMPQEFFPACIMTFYHACISFVSCHNIHAYHFSFQSFLLPTTWVSSVRIYVTIPNKHVFVWNMNYIQTCNLWHFGKVTFFSLNIPKTSFLEVAFCAFIIVSIFF